MLLNQLSGRPVRSSRPLTGNALYVGVDKLFMLLEVLGTESTAPTQAAPGGWRRRVEEPAHDQAGCRSG